MAGEDSHLCSKFFEKSKF